MYHRHKILHLVVIFLTIIIVKTALFEQQPSLESQPDCIRFSLVRISQNYFIKEQGHQPCVQTPKMKGQVPVFLSPRKRVGPVTPPGGSAVVQAVSRWLPTVAARIRVRATCGVCGGQTGTGAGFLRYFDFLCQSPFHQFLHHHNHPGRAQ
jgi:hypothetical protein